MKKPFDLDNKILVPGDIGTNIRIRRQALKMTQRELARRVNVTPQTISLYEKNKISDIPLKTKLALADALQCAAFMFGDMNEAHEATPNNELYVATGKKTMELLDQIMDFLQNETTEILSNGEVIIERKLLSTQRYIILDKSAWDKVDVETLFAFVEFMARRAAAKDNAKRRAAIEWEMNEEKEILKKANNKEGDTNEKP